jgi:hypothetical protein
MVHATQDYAAHRLTDRVGKGLGTPYNVQNTDVPSMGPNLGVFTYANLPSVTAVPFGSTAYATDIGPVWNNGTAWVTPNGGCIGQTAAIEFTQAAATFTTLTATSSNSGTTTRLTSAGVHGLTAASDGRYVYVSAAAGITAGLYAMTYVSTVAIDIASPYVALTTPVVKKVSELSTLYSVTVPAGMMGVRGMLEIEAFVECSNTATAKSVRLLFDGTQAVPDLALNGTSVYQQQVRARIWNQGDAAVQRCAPMLIDTASAVQATALTKDTATALVLAVQAQVAAAEEFIRISGVRVVVHPRS